MTGGAGFIGSFILKWLISEESFPVEKIYIVDNLSSGRIENIDPWMGDNRLSFIRGDISEKAVFSSLNDGLDVIIHLAAIVNVDQSFKDPILVDRVNIEGTLNVLEYARKKDVDLIIFPSSASVYGEVNVLPIKEEYCCNPLSPYAVSKIAGEGFCKVYSDTYGLNVVVLRLFNVYGPYPYITEYSGVITKFIQRILKGVPPIIFGSGEQTRDFIYIEDVCRLISLLVFKRFKGYDVFNVGTGKAVSINELAKMVIQISGKEVNIVYGPPRPGDIKHSVADISKLKKKLGFEPATDLRSGLIETYDYMRKYY